MRFERPTIPVEFPLRLEILSYWHPGTGRGDGALADSVVDHTPEGLPCVRGRTIKGLMREAARLGSQAGLYDAEVVTELFGSELAAKTSGGSHEIDADNRVEKLEAGRFTSKAGAGHFNDACLGRTPAEQEAWRAWARANPVTRQGLYTRFSSTRINAAGVAQDQTLRTIELIVPLDLTAFISGPADAPWSALSEAVQLFLRGLGSHRNRGLGRVNATLEVP